MAKKLMINCGTCDARNTKEETLQAYEHITINCGDVLVSPMTRDLLTRFGVTLNCGGVKEIPSDAKLVDINGSYEITGSTPVDEKTYLMVNGSLTIAPDAKEVLSQYVSMDVNGRLTCPKSLAPYLGKISVNGEALYYPDGAIVLKKNAVIDRLFALRAKNKLYWSPKRLIMVDPLLDPAALGAKGASFCTQEVILAEDKVEAMIPLIDETAQIVIVPSGTAIITDDLELEDTVLSRYGTKLFVMGDLSVNADHSHVLRALEYLNVRGDALGVESVKDALMEALTELGGKMVIRMAPKGRLIEDRISLRISKWMLEREPDGIQVKDCAKVKLDEDISNDLILAKLSIKDTAFVACTPEQESAVSLIAEDVMNIGQKEEDSMGVSSIVKGALGLGKELLDTKIINAGDYIL